MKSNSKKFSDRLVEVKYYEGNFPVSSVVATIPRIAMYTSYYKQNVSSRVVPVLVVIYKNKELSPEFLSNFDDRVATLKQNNESLDRFKYVFIKYEELAEFDVRELLKR